MRKLAFECAGAFEMPSLHMVNLEKENSNIVFARPKTVYKGSSTSFTRSQMLAVALGAEENLTSTAVTATLVD